MPRTNVTITIDSADLSRLRLPLHSIIDGREDPTIVRIRPLGYTVRTSLSIELPVDDEFAQRIGRFRRIRRNTAVVIAVQLSLTTWFMWMVIANRADTVPGNLLKAMILILLALALALVRAALQEKPAQYPTLARGHKVTIRDVHPPTAAEWRQRNPGEIRISPER